MLHIFYGWATSSQLRPEPKFPISPQAFFSFVLKAWMPSSVMAELGLATELWSTRCSPGSKLSGPEIRAQFWNRPPKPLSSEPRRPPPWRLRLVGPATSTPRSSSSLILGPGPLRSSSRLSWTPPRPPRTEVQTRNLVRMGPGFLKHFNRSSMQFSINANK